MTLLTVTANLNINRKKKLYKQPEEISQRSQRQEFERPFPLNSEHQRSVVTSSDIPVLRWGFEGRAAKGTPQATSPESEGWMESEGLSYQSRITCEKARPVLDASRELPADITHRHTSRSSSHVSEEQLPPSGSTCQLLHLLKTV